MPRPAVLTRDEGPVWTQKPPGWGREAFSLWWPWMWSAKSCLLISTLGTGPQIPACPLCPGWAWSPHVSHGGLLGHHFRGQLWPLNQPAPRGRSGDQGLEGRDSGPGGAAGAHRAHGCTGGLQTPPSLRASPRPVFAHPYGAACRVGLATMSHLAITPGPQPEGVQGLTLGLLELTKGQATLRTDTAPQTRHSPPDQTQPPGSDTASLSGLVQRALSWTPAPLMGPALGRPLWEASGQGSSPQWASVSCRGLGWFCH